MSKAAKSYVRNHNLLFSTPKLGSFRHALILSTSYPRTDMKGEFLQGKAGLIKSQTVSSETMLFAEQPLLLVPSSLQQLQALSQHKLLPHHTRGNLHACWA